MLELLSGAAVTVFLWPVCTRIWLHSGSGEGDVARFQWRPAGTPTSSRGREEVRRGDGGGRCRLPRREELRRDDGRIAVRWFVERCRCGCYCFSWSRLFWSAFASVGVQRAPRGISSPTRRSLFSLVISRSRSVSFRLCSALILSSRA